MLKFLQKEELEAAANIGTFKKAEDIEDNKKKAECETRVSSEKRTYSRNAPGKCTFFEVGGYLCR